MQLVRYDSTVERAVEVLVPFLAKFADKLPPRWLALRLLDPDAAMLHEINLACGKNLLTDDEVTAALNRAHAILEAENHGDERLKDAVASAVVTRAAEIAAAVTRSKSGGYSARDRMLDRILTGKAFGYPAMLLLLLFVFWLTISGANLPSAWLSAGFTYLEGRFSALLFWLHAPLWLHDLLVLGIFRVLSSVVADGDFLPAVHAAGGFRLSAPRGVQHGQGVPEVLRLRQAGADHVHGLRLQRGRRCRLPYY